MCLTNVTSTEEAPDAEGVGYKLMCRNAGGTYEGEFYSAGEVTLAWAGAYRRGKEYKREKKSHQGELLSDRYQRYPEGFHVFATLDAARRYWSLAYCWAGVIVRVRWRHRLAEGCQTYTMPEEDHARDLPVVIAKYMTIVEEVV